MTSLLRPALARRLADALDGETFFDPASRGRYATDASIYQVMPLGVVTPKSVKDIGRTIEAARDEDVSVLPRGGGTSQSGQTVNQSIVVDCSKYLNRVLDIDVDRRRCTVEPGIVLDELNRQLKPHGLWFPVDVSTSSRATIGGMAGNNSCGARSLRYGTMRDNVIEIDAILADGRAMTFGRGAADNLTHNADPESAALVRDMLALGAREADEIERRFPKLMRRVGGYNIDALRPGETNNLSHLLVGSEGTLAFSTRIELKLAPLPGRKLIALCHFGSFRGAMESTRSIVDLGPTAVELIDRTMIELARDIPLFRETTDRLVLGAPEALLLVEFAEDDPLENKRRLSALSDLMDERGFAWQHSGARWGGVVDVAEPAWQAALTEMRKAGLNIMMSMKDEAKPVSFVEDCAVPLDDLADYTERLTSVFEKHGTRGTWYAHASVGCLHVRPVLNLKLDKDVRAMRAIAEEAFAMVRDYKGSHSGEHGDGIVRSEFHASMFGERIVAAFQSVKDRFDPEGLFNPARIVRPPRMDDRNLFRYGPDYGVPAMTTALDWSAYPGSGGGFQGAVEMCNNNGACRKLAGGVMCPSFRATRDERDSTRGRANTLRLAISGQLGEGALTSDAVMETLSLCVSCKACRRECPTGVDMARMKIEALAARRQVHGLSLRDRLVAYLPRYAPFGARAPWLMNLRDRLPGGPILSEKLAGFSARRSLPTWSRYPYRAPREPVQLSDVGEVVLFADTFNRYFEPDNLRDARAVLRHCGYRVVEVEPLDAGRPLCCGRTFLAAGLVEEARREARRTARALRRHVARGTPVVGLEPSCLLTLRDEFRDLLTPDEFEPLASQTMLFEEFLYREHEAGRLALSLKPVGRKALLHGHCHQKSFAALGAVEKILGLIPDLEVETIESSCCGMAGAFGFQRESFDISMKMAELSLLPAVRGADEGTVVVADGTSCRHQITDGTGRQVLHAAQLLRSALAGPMEGGLLDG